MLYQAQIQIKGSFQTLPLEKLGIAPADVVWNEAYITMSVSDTKGLNEELKVQVNKESLSMEPFRETNQGLKSTMTLDATQAQQPIQFSTSFNLSGSQQLLFTPIGQSTSVHLQSAWPHPSFTGHVLPQSSGISDSGFTASWKSMGFKQRFPQQWIGNTFQLDNSASPSSVSTSAFGADLFVPVNGYQKTMRSIKYSFLCLVLTFAAFFLIEISNRRSAHPFHYGLIGLALILFYTLLLSISEYISFNTAYGIAAACTIGLITWFVRSLLASGRLTVLLSSILVLLYGYVFTILQLQDYSLLLGSIGLFITLAVVMHFSKRFQW
jgi:inner membrane protein